MSDTLRFCLLMVEGSPIGLTYLKAMVEHSFYPSFVLLSTQPDILELSLKTVAERTDNTFTWTSAGESLRDLSVPVYYTKNHNSEFTVDLIHRYEIDIAILGGTGIIKNKTIQAPKIGAIGVHPSILPDYKGCSAVEWSLYHNDRVGSTCHFITEEVDAGDIICTGALPIKRGDLYRDVRRKAYQFQSEILIKGLKLLNEPDYKRHIIKNVGGDYYKTMPDELVKEVKDMLEKQTYKHYID
ncbi:MAG: hypothetical protein HYY51_00740 [Candidatus Magasanikbacteria bacterium]|nr:hypothetical protein [Candidatus Magasanikbacteria bacterium]